RWREDVLRSPAAQVESTTSKQDGHPDGSNASESQSIRAARFARSCPHESSASGSFGAERALQDDVRRGVVGVASGSDFMSRDAAPSGQLQAPEQRTDARSAARAGISLAHYAAQNQKRPRFAYFPFGGGPRVCIGAGLAMMESTLLLATIAQRFHFELVPDHPIKLFPSVTLRPKYGVRAILRTRLRALSSKPKQLEWAPIIIDAHASLSSDTRVFIVNRSSNSPEKILVRENRCLTESPSLRGSVSYRHYLYYSRRPPSLRARGTTTLPWAATATSPRAHPSPCVLRRA